MSDNKDTSPFLKIEDLKKIELYNNLSDEQLTEIIQFCHCFSTILYEGFLTENNHE